MNNNDFLRLVEELVNGGISAEDHAALQQHLKTDADARRRFRERMGLEASLRTWAAESVESPDERSPLKKNNSTDMDSRRIWIYAVIAGMAVMLATPIIVSRLFPPEKEQVAQPAPVESPLQQQQSFGVVRQQSKTAWGEGSVPDNGRFQEGRLSLVEGVAELNFDSGTDVVMEAPCELVVLSNSSAQLSSGTVFVNVTDLSNGFTLEMPEAEIIDQGTEYAVALDDEAAEVHVFDGSVIWIPAKSEAPVEDLIEAGEARLYERATPGISKRIPFGKRQFVKRIETEIQELGGDALVAYDGFENLAGKIRRDRSGFGWSGGWEAARRGRGQLAEIIEAPTDNPFGIARDGRRMLLLKDGDDIRRQFKAPLVIDSHSDFYVSCLASKVPDSSGSLRVLFEKGANQRDQAISFGVSAQGYPFINDGTSINETAIAISDAPVQLFVFKISDTDEHSIASLRVYQSGEIPDQSDPQVWTVTSTSTSELKNIQSIRLTAGKQSVWQFDELKIGHSWESVAAINK